MALNYHHLHYFWTVAREGSVTRAAATLHVSQPAISAQLRKLERRLGARLFAKQGRGLVLTETGQLVYRYADEIFSVGRELEETVAGRTEGRPTRFAVGITESIPKLLAVRLLEPALAIGGGVRLVLDEEAPDRLLADLAVHALDLVLSDAPVPPTVRVRAFSHLLGECGVTIFGAPELVRSRRRAFPASLAGAPFLLPGRNAVLRRSLEQWFEERTLRPDVRGEIADSAVLKVLGQLGVGLFAAPSVVEQEIVKQYQVRVVGRIDDVRERFYAISVERRIRHPAVLALTSAARSSLFD